MTFLKWFLSSPRRAGGSSKGDWSPFEAAPPEAGKSVSAETLAALSGSGLPPGNGVWGHAPPSAFGRAAASPQTRQMRCWPSSERTTNPSSRRKRQDSLSVARPLPTETASLGFGGSPVGGGDKNSRVIFFTFLCGGYHLPSGCCGCVGTTRRGVYFSRKNGFLRVGALRRRTRRSLLHTVLFRRFYVGVVSLPSACASYR